MTGWREDALLVGIICVVAMLYFIGLNLERITDELRRIRQASEKPGGRQE